MPAEAKSFSRLVKIVQTLLGPQGCPWDKKQTHQSLRPYLIEEAYEVLEAIKSKEPKNLAEELGDLLLQIVLHSQLAAKEKTFNINDVINSISDKMVRRHPHVFGAKGQKGKAKDENAVWKKWEKIKAEEEILKAKQAGKRLAAAKSVLDKVPKALPALYRANLVQKRAARVGFDWDRVAGAWDKVREEMEEVHALFEESGPSKKISRKVRLRLEEEIGDLFFAIVNVSRKLDLDPEETLHEAVDKFTRRFKKIEEGLRKNPNMKLDQMDRIWEEVKKQEK